MRCARRWPLPGASVGSVANGMWRGTGRGQQTARMGKTLIGKARDWPRGGMHQARKVEMLKEAAQARRRTA
jgi:hypothetical protein